jgi:hypothetical protein
MAILKWKDVFQKINFDRKYFHIQEKFTINKFSKTNNNFARKHFLFNCRSFICFIMPVFSNKSGDARVPNDDLKKINTEDWRAEDSFFAVESSHSNQASS